MVAADQKKPFSTVFAAAGIVILSACATSLIGCTKLIDSSGDLQAGPPHTAFVELAIQDEVLDEAKVAGVKPIEGLDEANQDGKAGAEEEEEKQDAITNIMETLDNMKKDIPKVDDTVLMRVMEDLKGMPMGFPYDSAQAGGFPYDSAQAGGFPYDSAQAGGFPYDSAQAGGFPYDSAHAGGFPYDSAQAGGFPYDSAQAGGFPYDSAHAGFQPDPAMYGAPGFQPDPAMYGAPGFRPGMEGMDSNCLTLIMTEMKPNLSRTFGDTNGHGVVNGADRRFSLRPNVAEFRQVISGTTEKDLENKAPEILMEIEQCLFGASSMLERFFMEQFPGGPPGPGMNAPFMEHLPDGTVVHHLPDGTVVPGMDAGFMEHLPDGTVVHHLPDGTVVHHLPDGTVGPGMDAGSETAVDQFGNIYPIPGSETAVDQFGNIYPIPGSETADEALDTVTQITMK